MDHIIDIQFFKDTNNIIVSKEVAIVGLDNGYVAHWKDAPVKPIGTLSPSVRIENN